VEDAGTTGSTEPPPADLPAGDPSPPDRVDDPGPGGGAPDPDPDPDPPAPEPEIARFTAVAGEPGRPCQSASAR
jgi:hypothetical protein